MLLSQVIVACYDWWDTHPPETLPELFEGAVFDSSYRGPPRAFVQGLNCILGSFQTLREIGLAPTDSKDVIPMTLYAHDQMVVAAAALVEFGAFFLALQCFAVGRELRSLLALEQDPIGDAELRQALRATLSNEVRLERKLRVPPAVADRIRAALGS